MGSIPGNRVLRCEDRSFLTTGVTYTTDVDAMSHLTLTHRDVPLTPRKVWAAIQGT